METANFKNQLNQLIEKIQNENNKVDGMNPSYLFLLTNFIKIDSIDTLKTNADRLLYFLADSYTGNKELANEIGLFLLPYSSQRKKRK